MMRITLSFEDFIRITNIWQLQWYYRETEDSFHIFALLNAHVLQARIKFSEITEGFENKEFTLRMFRERYLRNAIKPVEIEETLPKPSPLPTTVVEEKGVPGQLPRRKVQEMNRFAVSMMSNGTLENFLNLINEEKKKRKKKPVKKATTTTTGGAGTAGFALIPVQMKPQTVMRRCFDCGEIVARGVKTCPKCGSINLGTGAPKPKFSNIPFPVNKEK